MSTDHNDARIGRLTRCRSEIQKELVDTERELREVGEHLKTLAEQLAGVNGQVGMESLSPILKVETS